MVRFKNGTGFSFIFAALIIFSAVISVPAYAKRNGKSLNEQSIRKFIEKTTKITSGANFEMSTNQAIQYLEKHLHPDARFKSTMSYQIPGFPTQESGMSVNKEDFIASVQEGAKVLNNYETQVEIKQINISDDKTKATVQTVSRETGVMPVNDGSGELREVPITGTSECLQIIIMGEKGVIQMYSANCETVIEFSGF